MHGRRSVVAPRAIATSPHALATISAVRILQAGGNAVEAAIAAASTIAVVYPHMNSIGGDNFWLVHDARAGDVRALMACGATGAGVTIDAYRDPGHAEIPRRGALAANTVPGAVDGWSRAHAYSNAELGGRLSLGDLLADAIGYARDGFPVTPSQADWTERNVDPAVRFGNLDAYAGFRRTFLRADGRPYACGDRCTLPDLARTLQHIATGGSDAFYRGPIAREIARALRAEGGLLTADDFAAHAGRWEDPLRMRYGAWELLNTPPPTQGLTSLQILNIARHLHLSPDASRADADYFHLMIEATKAAFIDRDAWIVDPDHRPAPLERLLSSDHGAAQAASIDVARVREPAGAAASGGDTIWLGVVDAAGNAVSLIQSIYFDFGSGIVAGDSGVLLQNRGSSFVLDEAHVNALRPGKRPFHTLNPAMALRDGRPELVYGTMGGEGQPQTQAALVTRILDAGMDVQGAIDAPRWLYGRTWGEPSETANIESRAGDAVIAELRRRGHDLRVLDAWDERVGHAQAIRIDLDTGMRAGGADPRGDGIAAGF